MAQNENPFNLPIYDGAQAPKIIHLLTDTHCHLDYLKSDDLAAIIQKANNNGIARMITISVSPENHQLVLAIAEKFEGIFCTQGIHPHQSKESTPEVMRDIEKNLSHEKVVAVGEIGLDYHYNLSERDIQKKVFEEHLHLSIKYNLPVVIHSREADDDTQSIIKNFNGKVKGVIHSFTSSQQLATFALDQGLYLGFNGIITFKNAQNVRDVLLMTPVERVLIETDSPFLAPVPWRGRENTPANIPWVAAHALQLKKMEPINFLTQIEKNASDLFGINT
jgi:TatD DNase family protein